MAFSHGTIAKLYAHGYDLSSYLREATGRSDVPAEDATTWGKASRVWLSSQIQDGTLSLGGLFDGTANAADQLLETALGSATKKVITWLPQGDGFGNVAKGLYSDQTQYDIGTPTPGLSTIAASMQGSAGLEHLIVIHPLTQRTGDDNGTSYDLAGALLTVPAWTCCWQITALSGGTVDLFLEDSADNNTFATVETFNLAAAAVPTGIHMPIAVTTATLRRYVRVRWNGLGANTCTFHAAVKRLS